MWSAVNEHITDGTSGIAPNNSPIALIIGTYSKELNKAVSIGKNSNITELLGVGELSRRIHDMQKTMDDCSIIVIKSQNDILGKIINNSNNPLVNILGNPLGTCTIKITAETSGNLSTAKLNILIDGDINYIEEGVILQDGVYSIDDLGVAISFDDAIVFEDNQSFIFKTIAPKSTYKELEDKITQYLDLYTPEFIFIAQEINRQDADLFAILSEQLFEDHKACFFLLETNLDNSLPINEAITQKKEEFNKLDGRFLSIICQDGFIKTENGLERRSPSGLCAGHITKSSVNQSIGATNKFPISQYQLPDNWTNSESRSLDESRFITLRTYAGLNNLF